jgi:trimeric autotransporter adhesin
MRIISANITGSLILNGVDVTDSLVSSSINSGSVSSKLDSLQSSTSSLNSFTSSYSTGSFTGSFKGDGTNLYNIPATGVTGLQLDKIASGAVTASVSANGFNVNSNVSITGSIVASGTSLVSGSSQINITGTTEYSTFSSSISTSIGSLSSSVATTTSGLSSSLSSSIGSLSSSVATTTVGTKNRVDSIEAKTGSYATTGSNTFIGTENITGNLTVTGSVIISSGSAVYNSSLNLTDTSSLTLNSGSNLYVYDSGIISGTFKGSVTGSLGINGNVSITGSIVASGTSLVSGSSQIDITSTTNYTTFSSSISSSIGNLSSSVATNTSGLSGRITTIEGRYATTGSNTFVGSQVITGSLYVTNDMIVQGCSCLQNITASAVSIGTNTVILNTATPAVRFAGISVQDSGSNAGVTGSIFWDGLCNKWIYSNPSTIGYSGGMLISGPRNTGTIGNESPLTCNVIAKSGGGDHIYDSCIIDDGTTVCVNANLKGSGQVCGLMGTFSCVGIGTQSPSVNLEVIGTIASGNADLGWGRFYYDTETVKLQASKNGTDAINMSFWTQASGGGFAERMRITGGGLIGVNTTTPSAEFQLNKNCDVTIALSNCVGVTSGNRGTLAFYNCATSTVAMIRAAAVTDNVGTELQFHTRPAGCGIAQVMTLQSTGIACFSSTLCANYLFSSTSVVASNTLFTGSDIRKLNNDQCIFFKNAAGNNEVTIAGNGNVGIGCTTPYMPLTVSGCAGIDRLVINCTTFNSFGEHLQLRGCARFYGGQLRLSFGRDDSNYMFLTHNDNDGFLCICRTVFTGNLILAPFGGVGINTSVVTTKLSVNSGINTSSANVLSLQQATNGAVKDAVAFGVSIQNGGESTNAADLYVSTATGGALCERMRITSGGRVGFSTSTPCSTQTVTIEGIGSDVSNQLFLKRQGNDQGLFMSAGGGNTNYNSYDGTGTVFGRHTFQSTKGSTTSTRLYIDENGISCFGCGVIANGDYNVRNTLFSTTSAFTKISWTNTYPATYNVADIGAQLDGNYYNGAIIFRTADADNANVLVERMRMDSRGSTCFSNMVCARDMRISAGVVSPTFYMERNSAYDDISTGQYLTLNDPGTQGLNAKFQQQFSPFVNTGEGMAWNHFRLLIRMTSNDGSFSVSSGCLRMGGYFYNNGWYCFGCHVPVGSTMDGGRGFRWVVMPWTTYSDFIGSTDVPGLAIYNQSSAVPLRIGAIYIQYKT